MRFSSHRSSFALLSAVAGVALFSSSAFGDTHTTGVPVLNSLPGALYTVYIDPSGFNFNGTWGGGSTPGNNLAINGDPATGTFDANEVIEINSIWAAMANDYRSFNVNVTTVDPAIAAGQASTDVARQAYYDSQAHMMHTIIGPGGTPGWHTGADGLALGGTISTVATVGSGAHTNFMFTEAQDGSPTVANGTYIGNIDAHETGHTFGLKHQSDFTGTTFVHEYTDGDAVGGNGSYVPIMGGGAGNQRVTWRAGSSNGAELTDDSGGPPVENQQNDVKTIMANDGMAYTDSGIGHSFGAATPLPVVTVPVLGTMVDKTSPLHRGIINPASSTSPNPIGAANYTSDFFSFISDGVDPITLTVNDGDDLLSPGTADPGITLRSTLSIFDSTDTLVAGGLVAEDSSTLFETYSGLLASGSYFAEINSFGGHVENTAGVYNAAQYFDMGGYFITGNGFASVPEPTSIAVLMVGSLMVLRRRRSTVA